MTVFKFIHSKCGNEVTIYCEEAEFDWIKATYEFNPCNKCEVN